MYLCSTTLNQISLKNSFGKVVFQFFCQVTIFAKWKFVFWPPFWNGTLLNVLFCWFMVVLGVYRYGESFLGRFGSTEKHFRITTQQNSYSISHVLGTVTTQWLPLWRCSHCSLVPDTVTTEQWLHRTHTLLGIHYHGAYVGICLLGT